jgi:hypothetical protein
MADPAGATTVQTTDFMKDYRASIERLRQGAAEAALIRDLTTDKTKREVFDRLYEHLTRLADEVEQAMSGSKIA